MKNYQSWNSLTRSKILLSAPILFLAICLSDSSHATNRSKTLTKSNLLPTADTTKFFAGNPPNTNGSYSFARLFNYLEQKVKIAKDDKTTGEIDLNFRIDTKQRVTNIQISKSLKPELDEQLVMEMKKYPDALKAAAGKYKLVASLKGHDGLLTFKVDPIM